MELLFPEGSLEQTEKMYQDAPAMRVFNSLIQQAIATAVEALPSGHKIRILEVGAGTGGTTTYVLPELPPQHTQYVYTDISELFLARAKEKFHSYPFIEYELLDIGQDPERQGFDPHGFDMVLASNVLHATPDLRRSLDNLKRLLAPGGLLVLLETTVPQRFGDLTVGLTEGWWGFTDTDLRPSYALISAMQWRLLLHEMGFTEIVNIPGAGESGETVLSHQSLIMARNPRMETESAAASTTDKNKAWLVLTDESGAGQKLAELMRSRGHRTTVVVKGESFKAAAEDCYVIDPLQPEHYQRMLANLIELGRFPSNGVVHMWGTDEHLAFESSFNEIDQAQQRICGSALYLVQALLNSGISRPPRLSLVTRGAQPVELDAGPIQVAQATLWGLGKVIALEHPELDSVCIDLDNKTTENEMQKLFSDVLLGESKEDQLALRHDEWFALRLKQSEASSIPTDGLQPLFRSDGVYLITGGLAGLGLLVAQWMVWHGARHLILMGRSEPSEAARKSISKMEQAGAEVMILQTDVADRQRLKSVLDEIDPGNGPIRGIFHCAGTLDDSVLLQQNWHRFRKVMAAKVHGAWNLHVLTRSQSLDWFVLFSSGASFLGSASQGNHAAANAFMDALAHLRRSQGLPALSINWGAWGKVGAATRGTVLERVKTQGMDLIEPEQGLMILEHLLRANPVQAGVLPIRWPDFLQVISPRHKMSLFENYVSQTASKKAVGEQHSQEPALFQELMLAPLVKRRNILFSRVESAAVKSLGLDSNDIIDPHQPLSELGLDSLMAVELRNSLSRLVGQPLPATLLFNYPSLSELVEYLADEVLPVHQDGPGQERICEEDEDEKVSPKERMRELDSFSEDEIAHVLKEKLESLS